MSNTTTRPAAKAKKSPTLARLTDGRVILSDVPFMVNDADGTPIQSRRIMGRQGLGLVFKTFEHVSGWVADTRKLGRDAAETLAACDVAVVDRSGNRSVAIDPGAEVERTTRSARATGAGASQGAGKAAPAAAKGVNGGAIARSPLAKKITAALSGQGIAQEIIEAAIGAAVAKADEQAKAVSAVVSAPAKAKGAKTAAKSAKPSKAAAPAPDGARVFTLAKGVNVPIAALAARQGLSRAGVKGVSIGKKSGRLVAYRADGAVVSADVDRVILAAVASVA